MREVEQRNRSWKVLSNRRLQNYGGLPHAKGMVPVPLPEFLQTLVDQLVSADVFQEQEKPNHALVNQYLPGQGINPHEDGPVFFPCAAIVSLQSPIAMQFYDTRFNPQGGRCPTAEIILRPRSLLCISADAYCHFLHGIQETTEDVVMPTCINALQNESILYRRERTSVTLRRSRKTLKFRF